LLQSEYHEVRLFAVVALTQLYKRAPRETYDAYCAHFDRINGWDLVDVSAPHVVGAHLVADDTERRRLYDWARSDHLWTRRIAMLATFALIKKNDYDDAIAVATILRDDDHDLIHKAVGWMLREVGKRDLDVECAFLDQYYASMPRTMLRYAIEKFDTDLRLSYLKGTRATASQEEGK